ncbi:MAG: hypothetical protein ACOY94_26440 [Bacillota bacterium]
MILQVLEPYRPIVRWGTGLWLLSTLIGALVAYLLKRPYPLAMAMANDVTVLLLLAPWFFGSLLSQGTKRSQVEGAMTRAWQGASYEAVERDIHDAMTDRTGVGDFSARAAAMALVVLALNIALRLLLDTGWGILPLLP